MVTSILASIICLIMVPLAVSGALSLGLFVSLSTAIYDLVNLMGWEMTRAVSQIAKFKEYMRDLTKFAALPERKETSGDIRAVDKPLAKKICIYENICINESLR